MNAHLDTIPSTPTTSATVARAATTLLQTDASPAQLVLRVALGLVMLPHGAQHLFGWFGGYGFAATLAWMTGALGIPAPIAGAGIVLEFVAPLALILGAGTRLAGLALAVFLAVAASTHAGNGFFINWTGALPAGVEGVEFHVLAIAMALALVVRGAGAASVDRQLVARINSQQ